MSRPLNIFIIEAADDLKQMLNAQQKAKLKERLQALYLLKTKQAKTLNDLVKYLGRAQSTIEYWLVTYREKGLLGLLAWNYTGNSQSAIPESIQVELRECLSQPHGFKRYGEIQPWLAEQHALVIPYKTVPKTVRYTLKAKLKVARPTPIQRDEDKVIEFKKTPDAARNH